MKKFLPVLSLLSIFGFFLVTQMAINGQGSNASKPTEQKKLYSAFENEFSKTTFKVTSGEEFKLSTLKKPIVIINFWASWCRPCLSEFKSLNKLLEKYGDKVQVIGINNDTEDAKKMIKITEKKHKLKFPSVEDEEGDYASAFNVTRVPASIVFARGRVIHFSNEEFDFLDKDFISTIERNIK